MPEHAGYGDGVTGEFCFRSALVKHAGYRTDYDFESVTEDFYDARLYLDYRF